MVAIKNNDPHAYAKKNGKNEHMDKTCIIADSSGKCQKCGNHCMKCECWLSDLNFLSEKEYIKQKQEMQIQKSLYESE
jgi:hypothetical protein